MRTTFLLAAFVSFPALATADTIWVPDDQPTVQSAIAVAVAGDEVVVRPGTYYESLDFLGKAITVRSEDGPAVTILDGSDTVRVVQFQSGETRATVLAGFTITHGRSDGGNGGGIDCTLISGPTIRDCIIADNYAYGLGGGMACRGFSDALILRCTFRGNLCPGGAEGGQGGGLSCFLSSPTIIDCVFDGNTAKWGGGLDFSGSYSVATNCLFRENHAYIGGGAVYCSVADPQLVNCTMEANSAAVGGALVTAGAVLPSNPVLSNCILWNNWPTEILVGIGSVTATNCDVRGGWPGVGNLDTDPLFLDPLANEYFLRQDPPQAGVSNPCVDAGDPASALLPGTTRTDWVLDTGIVDMGYHYTLPQAKAVFRNGGPNPASYDAVTLPVLGGTYTASVDLAGTTGHALAWLVGFATPLYSILGGGQVLLVNVGDPHAELLAQPMRPGPVAVYALPVPNDPALAGFLLATQALHIGGVAPFALSNAQDLVLGI